jgi:hypothetical protein
MIQKKEFLCNTLRSRLIFNPDKRIARPGGPQRRQIPGRDIGRGPPKAALQDGQNGHRSGVEPGRMEPEGPRIENTPIERREADADGELQTT